MQTRNSSLKALDCKENPSITVASEAAQTADDSSYEESSGQEEEDDPKLVHVHWPVI